MSLFNDFLGFVEPPILLERADYAGMFNDIAKMLGETPQNVTDVTAAARAHLKKNDRVTWYLRLWKIGLAETLMKNPGTAEKLPPGYLQKLVAQYAQRAKMTEAEVKAAGWTLYTDRQFLATMEHYLSLPIVAIQRKVFSFDDPEVVIDAFRSAEAEWQKETKDAFVDDDAHAFIKFPNGLAWYNLDRAYCELEAKAMGHCGNQPRANTEDTILSLRKTMTRAATQHQPEMTLHKPILTFILNGNGFLTEMKGRFNEKPEQKYHNEIVALLRDPIVHGIKGGGYRPEANFSLNDLDEATKAQLLEEKPELGGLWELYTKRGIADEDVMEMLREKLGEYNAVPATLQLSDDQKEFKIETWKNLSQFCSRVDDGVVSKMLDILDGTNDDIEILDSLSNEEIIAVISSLNDADYHHLMRALEVRPVAHNDANFQKAVMLAAQRLNNSAYYDMLLDAANEAAGTGELHSLIRERLSAYIECGWSFENHWVGLEVDDTDLDAPVSLHISVDDLVRLATADEEGDDEYSGYLGQVRHSGGWDVISDYQTERRDEEGLSAIWGSSTTLDTDPAFKAINLSGNGATVFDPHKIGRRFMHNAFHKKTYHGHGQGDLFKR